MKTTALCLIAFFLSIILSYISEYVTSKRNIYVEKPITNIYREYIDSTEYHIFVTEYKYDTYVNVIRN